MWFSPLPFSLPLGLHLHAALGGLASAVVLATAYVFQYGLGYLPCTLCLWQRFPHFALVGLALMALAVRRRTAWVTPILVLMALVALSNGGLGVFHSGVEYGWWPGLSTCGAPTTATTTLEEARALIYGSAQVVACDRAAWVFLGLSMAGWNALVCFCLALWYLWPLCGPVRSTGPRFRKAS